MAKQRMTLAEAALALGKPESEVRQLIDDKHLPAGAAKDGTVYVLASDVAAVKRRLESGEEEEVEEEEIVETPLDRIREAFGRKPGMSVQVWHKPDRRSEYTYLDDVEEVFGPGQLRERFGAGYFKLILLDDGKVVDEIKDIPVGDPEAVRGGRGEPGGRSVSEILQAQRMIADMGGRMGGGGADFGKQLELIREERKTMEAEAKRYREEKEDERKAELIKMREESKAELDRLKAESDAKAKEKEQEFKSTLALRLEEIKLERERIQAQLEGEKERLKADALARDKDREAESERSKEFILAQQRLQNDFLGRIAEIDNKRQGLVDDKIKMVEKNLESQEKWLEKYATAKLEAVQAGAPATGGVGEKIVDAVQNGINQFGGIIRERIAQVDSETGVPGAPVTRKALPNPGQGSGGGSPSGGPGRMVVQSVYASDGFKEIMKELALNITKELKPEPFAGMLGAMLAADPRAGLVLYLFQSRSVEEIVKEAGLPADVSAALASEKGKAFVAAVLRILTTPEE